MQIAFKQVSDSATPMLERFMDELATTGRQKIQGAMAESFRDIAANNFGFSGEDRPVQWPALSYQYAKEFHDGNRIPKLILSGELQQSIQIDNSNPGFAEVFTDNPYAELHQYGDESTNLPARPFFPMDEEGNPTDYTLNRMIQAAEKEIEQMVSNYI